MNLKKNILVSVVGPTAVGKTALAIEIAKYFNTEIVSADSRQFYREMNIGTAKPDKEELAQVKHHFIDSHSIKSHYSVGMYEKEALVLLDELFQRHDVVVLVGGSGLFFKAIWEGFDEMPAAELLKVWRSLKASPHLKRYLAAFFFFNMGVQTVMYLATLFGTDVLQLDSSKLIMTILLIQLVASVGAWLSARFSATYGNKAVLQAMIAIWIVVCIAAYFISTEYQFYALAFVVGMIMGGVQALARATYTKLIPETTIDHASYFSFFDVTFNISIVFGTFSFGLINQLTGSMRNSALVLAIFFVAGMLMLTLVKSDNIKKASSAGV